MWIAAVSHDSPVELDRASVGLAARAAPALLGVPRHGEGRVAVHTALFERRRAHIQWTECRRAIDSVQWQLRGAHRIPQSMQGLWLSEMDLPWALEQPRHHRRVPAPTQTRLSCRSGRRRTCACACVCAVCACVCVCFQAARNSPSSGSPKFAFLPMQSSHFFLVTRSMASSWPWWAHLTHQRLIMSSFRPQVACLCRQSSHGLNRTATAPGCSLPHLAHHLQPPQPRCQPTVFARPDWPTEHTSRAGMAEHAPHHVVSSAGARRRRRTGACARAACRRASGARRSPRTWSRARRCCRESAAGPGERA